MWFCVSYNNSAFLLPRTGWVYSSQRLLGERETKVPRACQAGLSVFVGLAPRCAAIASVGGASRAPCSSRANEYTTSRFMLGWSTTSCGCSEAGAAMGLTGSGVGCGGVGGVSAHPGVTSPASQHPSSIPRFMAWPHGPVVGARWLRPRRECCVFPPSAVFLDSDRYPPPGSAFFA